MLKGLGGLAGIGDMAKMMKTAQQMQVKMAEMAEELGRTIVTGEAGGGLVKVTATAKGEFTGLAIDPSLFRPEDREVVEDLILAAMKDAQKRGQERTSEEQSKMMAALGLPADAKLPF